MNNWNADREGQYEYFNKDRDVDYLRRKRDALKQEVSELELKEEIDGLERRLNRQYY